MVTQSTDQAIGIILNEFGDIKLESEFIEKNGLPIAELQGGCMCCVAKGDVPRAINLLLEQNPNLNHLIIEASGLSDPEPIKSVIANDLVGRVRLDMTLGIVDALNFFSTLKDNPIIMSQLSEVDAVLITKAEQVSSEQLQNLINHFNNLLLNTPSLIMNEELDPQLFLSPQMNPKQSPPVPTPSNHHHDPYQQWWFKSDQPLKAENMYEALSKLDPQIIRAKGVVFFTRADGQVEKLLYSAVCGRGQFTSSTYAPGEPTNSNILFLGQHFDTSQLENSLT